MAQEFEASNSNRIFDNGFSILHNLFKVSKKLGDKPVGIEMAATFHVFFSPRNGYIKKKNTGLIAFYNLPNLLSALVGACKSRFPPGADY